MKTLDSLHGFLLDMDGTIYLGDALIQDAAHFLEVLESEGKDYLFLTNNSSKNRRSYSEKFARLGMPVPEEKILTSGEATALYLKTLRPESRLYVMGTPDLESEFCTAGFKLDETNPDLVVLGFDTSLTYARLWKLCDFVRMGLPYIATHPDFNCPTDNGLMPDIGAMIAFVKASTGREPDEIIGKPNRGIVEAAQQKMGLAREDLAMIGDRLYTDVALGQTNQILTVLVLSGETTAEDASNSIHVPDYIFPHIGAVADWLERHR